MPAIKRNESEKSYVSRCIAYVMKNENATREQAAGKCYGLYRHKKKRK
jgi:hypothetical protein